MLTCRRRKEPTGKPEYRRSLYERRRFISLTLLFDRATRKATEKQKQNLLVFSLTRHKRSYRNAKAKFISIFFDQDTREATETLKQNLLVFSLTKTQEKLQKN
jgi:hypothetical protein